MDTAIEVPPNLVVSSLTDLYGTRYTALSWGIVVVFDHLITFGQEVELVWKAKFNLASALFFVNRYYGLCATIFNCYMIHATGHSQKLCDIWLQWQAWTAVFAQSAITQVILILRVRALYLNDRHVTLLLVTSFFLAMGAAIVLDLRIVASLTMRAVTLQGARICALGRAPPFIATYYIPIAVFETLVAVLAIARWIHECRDSYAPKGFFQALVYDSAVYFVVMTLAYITNIVMWIVIPRTPELPVGLVMALSCVMASRLLLNIRARQRDTVPDTTLDYLACGQSSSESLE